MGGTVSLLGVEDRAFLRAVKKGDAETALNLLKLHHALLKAKSWRSGHTAWHYIMLRKDRELFLTFLQMLEQQKLKLLEDRPLHPTVDIQKSLNRRNSKGQTPLMVACQMGDLDTVVKLLDLGVNMWERDRLGRRSAVHYAAQYGHAQCINVLLTKAGDTPHALTNNRFVDVRDAFGYTALHVAIWHQHADAVRKLLEFGASLVLKPVVDYMSLHCTMGATSLHMAAHHGNVEVISMLLVSYLERMEAADINRVELPALLRHDPRRMMNAMHQMPFTVAILRGHIAAAGLLNPIIPLTSALGNTNTHIFGPKKLKVLATQAHQEHLLSCISAIEHRVKCEEMLEVSRKELAARRSTSLDPAGQPLISAGVHADISSRSSSSGGDVAHQLQEALVRLSSSATPGSELGQAPAASSSTPTTVPSEAASSALPAPAVGPASSTTASSAPSASSNRTLSMLLSSAPSAAAVVVTAAPALHGHRLSLRRQSADGIGAGLQPETPQSDRGSIKGLSRKLLGHGLLGSGSSPSTPLAGAVGSFDLHDGKARKAAVVGRPDGGRGSLDLGVSGLRVSSLPHVGMAGALDTSSDLPRAQRKKTRSIGSAAHLAEVSAEARESEVLAMCRLARLTEGVHSVSSSSSIPAPRPLHQPERPAKAADSSNEIHTDAVQHPEIQVLHTEVSAQPAMLHCGVIVAVAEGGGRTPGSPDVGAGCTPFAGVDVQRHRTVSWAQEVVEDAREARAAAGACEGGAQADGAEWVQDEMEIQDRLAQAAEVMRVASLKQRESMDDEACPICFEDAVLLRMAPCKHQQCLQCCREMARLALTKPVLCPFCRGLVRGFVL